MKQRFLITGFAVAALTLAGSIVTAQASIIGATPNTNFSNSSVMFGFGDATYTFSNDGGSTGQLSVMTGGSAQVTLLGGSIPNAPHQPDGVGGAGQSLPTYSGILGPQTYVYDSFPTAAVAPTFQFYGPYIGLKFLLDGQVHYGYANVANLDTLVSYAYNSVPDAGIVTGEAITTGPTAVPEPSSLAMFGLGLCFIGVAAGWLRRRRSNRTGGVAPQIV